MASYRVAIKPSARRELAGLPDSIIARILPSLPHSRILTMLPHFVTAARDSARRCLSTLATAATLSGDARPASPSHRKSHLKEA